MDLEQFLCTPYDESQVNFSIGEAIAALTIVLIIPQFIRPIYTFRLKASGLHFLYIYVAVFVGTGSVFIASLIPIHDNDSIFLCKKFWELLGGVSFVIVFLLLTYSYLCPSIVRNGKFSEFAHAAAEFLAHAKEDDRVSFANDLYHNIGRLITKARFNEWTPDQDGFFDFRYRREIQDSKYANILLELVSEPAFCEVLVCRSPWNVARIVNRISNEYLVADSAQYFIRELARQAIIASSSMVSRELDRGGFRAAPVLSSSLFLDTMIVQRYRPLDGMRYEDFSHITIEMMERLNHAILCVVKIVLKPGTYVGDNLLSRIDDLYSWATEDARQQVKIDRGKYRLILPLHFGMEKLIEDCTKHLKTLNQVAFQNAYADPTKIRDATSLGCISEAIVCVLETVSIDFDGYDDPFWSTVIGIFHELFPRDRNALDGMDPLQQRVALKLIKKIEENMLGWFPALSKVMLSVLGPYRDIADYNERSAYGILINAFYSEFKKYSDFFKNDPEKAQRFLPSHVQFRADEGVLVHRYRDGKERVTELEKLSIPKVLLDRGSVGQNL